MTASTIFALASGGGRAGVAVIRISGPAAGRALTALTALPLPKPRRATRRRLIDPADGEVLDDALVLWFVGPHSFTGEDVTEFHLHGGRAVVAGVVAALAAQPGLRPAEPGEFTRRAFQAGKLDLAAVEGLADLVEAETSAQRRQAMRQYDGALTRVTEAWRRRLIGCLAHAEATIDFADEDLPDDLLSSAQREIAVLTAEIDRLLDDGRRGERLREGIHVAIVGAPNVGKSSLLNALARRDAAIVSDIAGTTRDVVEVHLDLAGYPVILADTAGVREGGDVIEREGIGRAMARAEDADIVLLVTDATSWPVIDPAVSYLHTTDTVVVINKIDLIGGQLGLAHDPNLIPVSVRQSEGIDAVEGALTQRCLSLFDTGESGAITRARHRTALKECANRLRGAAQARLPELMAEDLRMACRALGRVAGSVDVEDLLDVIFREFCIGK